MEFVGGGRHTVPSVGLSSTALLLQPPTIPILQVCCIKCAHCCFEHACMHTVHQAARWTPVLRCLVVSAITISPDVSGRKLGPRGGVSWPRFGAGSPLLELQNWTLCLETIGWFCVNICSDSQLLQTYDHNGHILVVTGQRGKTSLHPFVRHSTDIGLSSLRINAPCVPFTLTPLACHLYRLTSLACKVCSCLPLQLNWLAFRYEKSSSFYLSWSGKSEIHRIEVQVFHCG